MITAEQKPMDEIRGMIAPYKRILVLGCASCVAECAPGGKRDGHVSVRPANGSQDGEAGGRDRGKNHRSSVRK